MRTEYPFEERGSFQSDDEELNAIFDICRYTLRLCSNEFLMDTPWREQAQWLGDVASVTLPGIYACFGDTTLPAKFLRQVTANQHVTGMLPNVSNRVSHAWQGAHVDYSLWWVMGAWNHYIYSGEREWIDWLYPVCSRVVQAFLPYVNERGMIEDMPYRVFIDWSDVDRRGECAALNAIFYGALEAVTRMAEVKHDSWMAGLCRRYMGAICTSFQESFFDAQRGCFADARIEGELSPKTSEHTNMAAIRWGLCDDETAAAVVRLLYEEQSISYTEAQPFFTAVVLQALCRMGRFDLALQMVRDRWGKRMVSRGLTSTAEEWTLNGTWRSGQFQGIMRTISHAWSAFPAEFLIRYLAGIEILSPGCRRLRVDPPPVDFDYQVRFPTPSGEVIVERKGGHTGVSAPPETEIV
jgi:hypothetical protein